MEISSDPYEQKLYHMFKSHDIESVGTLDKISLIKLCNSLELNDQGNVLINSMLKDDNSRVSFKDFKDALLNFLRTEMENSQEKNFVITSQNDSSTKNAIINSPGREVSPKLVVGTKKYGRRSRPQSLIIDSSSSDSDENNETSVMVSNTSDKTHKVQRSSSQSEIQNTRRRRPCSGGTKLKRCASLPAQQRNQKIKDRNKQQTSSISGQNQLTSSVESLGNLDFENLSHTIYEIWKNYGNELGTNFLNRLQLEIVCERVGLYKIAGKVAEEVFDKLNLNARDTISFTDFIGLIQNDVTSADNNLSDTVTLLIDNNDNRTKLITTTTTKTTTTELKNESSILSPIIIHNNICNLKDTSIDIDLHAKERVSANSIIEMWQTVGVNEPRLLLSNLGFDDDEINITQLLSTLEEEIRGLHGESQTSILKATLVLRKAEISSLQQIFRQLFEENKKLHADNKEANKRAAMLAQEIDERHASLEDTTKSEIRLLEQRHAEVVRELSSQIASDREHWSNLNSRLEMRIKNLEQEENRYKFEIQTIHDENSALEKEQIALQKQITDLLETNIKLNNEIIELEDKQRNEDGKKGEKETEEVLELIDKITSLQVENANLRDKNDELVVEVEGLSMELNRIKNKKSLRNSCTSANGGDSDALSDDVEQTSLGIKRRGDSPSKARIPEESPRLGKLRKCNNDNSESETSGDWVALNTEMNSTMNNSNTAAITPSTTSGFSQDFSSISDGKDEEIRNLKEKISALENELNELRNALKNENENDTIAKDKTEDSQEIIENNKENEIDYVARCQELENSLEQMRKAYEDCEDYWQTKLSEERQLFEKERQIYEEEQHENDKKFTELMEKVREYEEQFDKEGRLSPIEEKDTLEQQYADLEIEVEEIRKNAQKIFEEKTKEITDLHQQIKELKKKLGGNINIHNGDMESPASSPISYLWNQSTIQTPARDYQNPNWNSRPKIENNTLIEEENTNFESPLSAEQKCISPIQKPISSKDKVPQLEDETASNASGKSFETHSVASTHSVHKSSASDISVSDLSPNAIKEELKKLKFFEVQLKEQIKDLVLKRDTLIMDLQQLHEAKPVLEKAYARATHPSLIQKVNQLEQKNRHLQNVIRQQQQYAESIMHQNWQQQRQEIIELRNRLETQGMLLAEQVQRLANSDMLVKDLYVENSHLAATVQRLEQQRNRTALMHHQGLTGMP